MSSKYGVENQNANALYTYSIIEKLKKMLLKVAFTSNGTKYSKKKFEKIKDLAAHIDIQLI